VHHFDLYRLGSAAELVELGLDEALEQGAALVEWPENGLPDRLLEDALKVSMFLEDEGIRTARVRGPARWRRILEKAGP
jgi:tRNA A37 threonylcarbamoyladenosine biosynthesis protein TsaE